MLECIGIARPRPKKKNKKGDETTLEFPQRSRMRNSEPVEQILHMSLEKKHGAGILPEELPDAIDFVYANNKVKGAFDNPGCEGRSSTYVWLCS